MSRPFVQRFLTVVLACAWVLPGLLALAVTLHVELHHHGHGPADERAVELALTVEHGHSHEVGEADHDHPVTRSERRQVTLAPGQAALRPWAALPVPAARGTEGTAPEPLRPPPRPLFTLHCALLS